MLSKDDITLHRAFQSILSDADLNGYVCDIAELIYKDELNVETLQKILTEYDIKDIRSINKELLNLLILYIRFVLEDYVITDNEKRNIEVLKLFFKIKEGDFYKYKYHEIEQILHVQFEKLYFDNHISREEAQYNFMLRDIFDLSHQQFDQFKRNEIKRALDNGANIVDLDTSIFPK